MASPLTGWVCNASGTGWEDRSHQVSYNMTPWCKSSRCHIAIPWTLGTQRKAEGSIPRNITRDKSSPSWSILNARRQRAQQRNSKRCDKAKLCGRLAIVNTTPATSTPDRFYLFPDGPNSRVLPTLHAQAMGLSNNHPFACLLAPQALPFGRNEGNAEK